MRTDDPDPNPGGRLLPVVARAIELGRGPPPLVRWLRERLAARPPDPSAARLARELADLLRERNGVLGTIGGPAGRTVSVPG